MQQYKFRQDCNYIIFYNFYSFKKKKFDTRRIQVVYR